MDIVAVMAVPFGILINLRRSFRGKVGLTCLFCVGFIAIIVAMIRVFLIWAKTGSSTPSPAWLALWAIIEGAVGGSQLPSLSSALTFVIIIVAGAESTLSPQ